MESGVWASSVGARVCRNTGEACMSLRGPIDRAHSRQMQGQQGWRRKADEVVARQRDAVAHRGESVAYDSYEEMARI